MGKGWEHSSHEWCQVGREVDSQISITYWTWKPVSYWSRRVVSITLRSRVQNCGRAPSRTIQCIILAVGPLLPYVHLASTYRHSHDECSQAFPVFWSSSTSLYYCEYKRKVKTGEGGGLGTRLVTLLLETCKDGNLQPCTLTSIKLTNYIAGGNKMFPCRNHTTCVVQY